LVEAVNLTSDRLRIYAVILVMGVFAQISQAVLIRECLVVFYGNEISLGAFFGSWLLWLALGSGSVLWLGGRPWVQQPLPLLRWLLLALPLVLMGQVMALRSVRGLLHISSAEFVPLGELFLSLFLITIPGSFLLGIAFPLACRALTNLRSVGSRSRSRSRSRVVGEVSWLYAVDSLGALVGGVLFTFVLVAWLGLTQTLAVSLVALGLSAWLLPVRRNPWLGTSAILVAVLGGLAILVTSLGEKAEWHLERLRFARLQPGLELLEAVSTRYGHVAVAKVGEQYSVVRDGRIAESFPMQEELQQDAAYFYSQAAGAKRVLLFGGLAGGLPAELLRYPVERVDVVEEDRRAFDRLLPYLDEASRRALADPRLGLYFEDGRRFVNRLSPEARYDLVLVLNADPASASSNRYFTTEFYQRVGGHLSDDGVFCTRVSSASNYLGGAVRSYSGSVFRTLGSAFTHLALSPGDVHTYCAAQVAGRVTEDPDLLAARYRATALDPRPFPAESFRALLPAESIRFVREQLDAGASELNTDARPLTYYLNMVLWGKLTASGFIDWLERLRNLGPWPYLIPCGLGVGLWMLRRGLEGFARPRLLRQTGSLVLATLGFIAMAVQLLILLSYQAHVGFMFERIALLNGVFMTGLALGAGGVGRRLAEEGAAELKLMGVTGLVVVGLLALPALFDGLGGLGGGVQEAVYVTLSLLVGLLTGAGFPLGVHLTQTATGRVLVSSGASEAADSLGGALGGLLTGALLVPLLGVRGTCYLLVGYALIGLLPLLFARFAPEAIPALRIRGGRAFPWPGLSWFLGFAVLLAFAWNLLSRQSEPGPQVRFDERLLEAVSGSSRFERFDQPFLWYRGTEDTAGGAVSATAASMAAAPQVLGYAGPINVLLAIDQGGLLRGVRYIASRETPAYIEGIEVWLDGLRGADLRQAPLSLDRVDGLSGATVTSRAVLEAVNRSAQALARAAFGADLVAEPSAPAAAAGLWTPGFLVTLGLLALFFPVYLRGDERLRLLYLGVCLALLGVWLNSLVTEVDLINLSQGNASSWEHNPQRWLLIGFVAVTGVLFGQAWCGYLCPFGALQELVSRLGRWAGWRVYPDRPLETRVRYLKFLLLALMLVAVWLSGEGFWAAFNPMQHAFGGHWTGWMLGLLALSLVGSLFYVRFWCRYFCPFGAFLALTNKIALLRRFGPRRRFEHCDLGVHEEYDIDCIQCHRCLTGRDTRLKTLHRPAGLVSTRPTPKGTHSDG
jgi:predicted membrane-bound spermidine synthase